jgi:hypothetical protein
MLSPARTSSARPKTPRDPGPAVASRPAKGQMQLILHKAIHPERERFRRRRVSDCSAASFTRKPIFG